MCLKSHDENIAPHKRMADRYGGGRRGAQTH
jgi:hypothetical protein